VDVRHIRAGELAESYAGAILVEKPLAILREIEAIGKDQKLIDGLGKCSREGQKDLPVSMVAPTILLRQACIEPF
jgi:predicted Zn-dependent protease